MRPLSLLIFFKMTTLVIIYICLQASSGCAPVLFHIIACKALSFMYSTPLFVY